MAVGFIFGLHMVAKIEKKGVKNVENNILQKLK